MSSGPPTTAASNSGSNRLPITDAACKSARSFWRKSVDARGQQALHAPGSAAATALASNSNLPATVRSIAPLDEEAHNLFGEERIALGLLRHLPR